MPKYLNLPAFLLVPYSIKILISGGSLEFSLIIMSLCALYGWLFYLQDKKDEPVNKSVHEDIKKIQDDLKYTREKVNAITLGSHLKR